MGNKRPKTDIVKELYEEKRVLDNKLMKLNNFIRSTDFITLSDSQREMVKGQSYYMTKYSVVLRDRIVDITSQES